MMLDVLNFYKFASVKHERVRCCSDDHKQNHRIFFSMVAYYNDSLVNS